MTHISKQDYQWEDWQSLYDYLLFLKVQYVRKILISVEFEGNVL